MSVSQPKYNPGILGDEQLIRGFVARQSQLQLVLQHLRENAASTGANQHVLIVGPRGSGKTTLVRRAAAEVRRDTDLSTHWHPIVFGEESYQVSTPGEFWLEALFHVAEENHDQRWLKTVDDLKAESDDVRLRERALAQLLDFADERHSRLLLVVENLNMLLGEQMREHGDWELRHTLQTEPRLMLLGTATSRFTEVSNIDEAWFELFTIHDLAPLNLDECAQVWELVTGTRPVRERIRAVQILTGGNPRLLRIMAEFAIGRSFRELLGQLVQLVDEHTEYFKSHLDVLPAAERKVFVALLEQWNAVEAREVAQAARIQVSPASALLNRLVQRGAVEVVEHRRRKKLYQAAERLYNIYYLMRRRGHPSSRVQAAVDFMVHFYQGGELVEAVGRLAAEALQLTPDLRKDHYFAYCEIFRRGSDQSLHSQILKQTPPEFLSNLGAEVPAFRFPADLLTSVADAMLQGIGEAIKQGKNAEMEATYRAVIVSRPTSHEPWVLLALILHKMDRSSEAEQALRKAISIKPDASQAWATLGFLLDKHSERAGEAEEAFRKALALDPSLPHVWVLLGDFLAKESGRAAEAEQAYRKAIEIDANSAFAWQNLGRLMLLDRRWQDAEHALRESVRLNSESVMGWLGLEIAFVAQRRLTEAKSAALKAMALTESNEILSVLIPLLTARLGFGEEPGEIIQEAKDIATRSASNPEVLIKLAEVLLESTDRDCIDLAEQWTRDAAAKEPTWRTDALSARILGIRSEWSEALTKAKTLVDAAATVDDAQSMATDFLINAAAAGHAGQALVLLNSSPGAARLEPLIVGLELFLGEAPAAAKEILEIGQDVAERIRKRKESITALQDLDNSSPQQLPHH